jgi:hypothetical protein
VPGYHGFFNKCSLHIFEGNKAGSPLSGELHLRKNKSRTKVDIEKQLAINPASLSLWMDLTLFADSRGSYRPRSLTRSICNLHPVVFRGFHRNVVDSR